MMWEATKPVSPVTSMVVEDGARAGSCGSDLIVMVLALKVVILRLASGAGTVEQVLKKRRQNGRGLNTLGDELTQ